MRRLPDAAREYRQAIEIFEAALGPEDPEVAVASNNLRSLLIEQGKLEEARDACARAWEICEARLEPRHPHRRAARQNLSRLHAMLRDRRNN